MSRVLIFILLWLAVTPFAYAHHHVEDTSMVNYEQAASGMRVDFVENLGQWDAKVRFKANTAHGEIYLEDSCFTILLCEPLPHSRKEGRHTFHHSHAYRRHAYRTTFVGASSVVPQGRGKGISYDNYYLGNDPSRWKSHVSHYGCVLYEGLYPNIDLKVYGAEQALKYDIIVHPYADPHQVALRYEGVDRIALRNGNLVISTSAGKLVESCPKVYQMIDGKEHKVEARYLLKGDVVRFVIGDYDASQPLIIDPYLVFSTYSGSYADNWGTTATYDSHKNTYTAGLVFGSGYPTSLGAYDTTFNGNADVGIFKFDTSGSQRLYATYLGGNYADMPHSMFVNAFDELIIFGTTGSANFPTTRHAFDTTFHGGQPLSYLDAYGYHSIYFPNGSDIFVSRLNADGTALLASTYVGGSLNDGLNYREEYNVNIQTCINGNGMLYYNYGDGARGEVITDNLNNVYIGTTTFSHDFPVATGSLQQYNHGHQEGVVFKLDHNLSNMLWSTYLGGYDDDAVYSIDVDSDYNLLVCGGTTSNSFPTTTGAYNAAYNGGRVDGFVTKISFSGDRIMASTFFGSDAYDQCYFVRCGKNNDVFLFGQTEAAGSTLIFNANYNTPNSGNFVARLKPNLDTLVWSTVFGTGSGSPNISPTAFAADICNRVYLSGWGRDFVASYTQVGWRTAGTWGMETTPNAYQRETDGQDFYIACMSSDANTLEYATFFGEMNDTTESYRFYGSDHVDGGTSRFDRMATLYQSVCGGCSGSDNFPTTTGAWSEVNNYGNCNNALFRFNIHDDYPVADFSSVPVGCAPYTVTFQNAGRGNYFLWSFSDGDSSTAVSPTHTFDSAGLYTVRLIASMPDGCSIADTLTREVLVLHALSHTFTEGMSCDGNPLQIGYTPMFGATYLWIQGEVSDSTISNPWVQNSGDYVVRISAAAGCSETDTFHIDFLQLLDTVIVTHPSCPGSHDGSITIVSLGNLSPNAEYILNGVSSSDSVFQNLAAGTYQFTLRDGLCNVSRTVVLTDPVLPDLRKESFTTPCTDSCQGWIHLQWGEQDTLLSNLCHGTHITTLTNANGCEVSDTTAIVTQHSLSALRVWADDTLIYLGNATQLHATPIPRASYQWQPTYSLSHPQSPNTTATPTDTLATYYLTATDSTGCTATDSLTIHCINVNCGKGNIIIPNAFTPNGDGKNDHLCFSGDYVTEFYIAIFTRWGEMVWESNSIHDCWDGRYQDNWCQPGVYVYTCRIRCEANQETSFKGDITLIR